MASKAKIADAIYMSACVEIKSLSLHKTLIEYTHIKKIPLTKDLLI